MYFCGMIKLLNDLLTVSIHEKGAELQSIQYNDIEYLWQADEKYWGKHSPVLFPIVGELKNEKYTFNSKDYTLPRHGFARNKTFEAKQTSSTSALFTLRNDSETLTVYPFKFILRVEYSIKETELFCTYHIENINDDVIYFSVGGHPAFNVPLNKDLVYTDYVLKFDNDDTLKKYLLHNGLTNDDTELINLDNKSLQLKPELFYKDAIVLKHINSKQITLKTSKDAHGLKFKFHGFPFFGIWAAKDAPFVCLEPWCGIADNINKNGELINKEGINTLPAGDKWQRTWSVELF